MRNGMGGRIHPRESEGKAVVARSVEDVILDAARSCILDFGIRRTTLAEVARRARVSRPTVYRRWSDTRAVVADLLTREVGSAMPALTADGPARRQLVEAVSDVVSEISGHPLFAKIRRSDQDMLTTYIFERLGTSQKAIIDQVAYGIEVGQGDGSIRTGPSREMATMVLLMAQSAVQSAVMVSEELSGPALIEHLRHAVDAYLMP